ncbi:MAG: tyrosine-type recombinase/integrase [Methylovulum sp.]|nr:tyrosine-type recombinase/integrase [Methylovulum sp.]
MAILNFTDKGIKKLPPHDSSASGKAKEYTDKQVSNLKLSVGKSKDGKTPDKTFSFRGMLKGQKVFINIGSADAFSVEDARKTALGYKAQVERGIDPRIQIQVMAAMPTVHNFVTDQYLPWAYQTKKTAVSDESKFKHHIIKRWGKKRLDEITRRDVEQYHAELCNSHTPATANRHLSLVSRVFTKAMDWGILTANPAKGIKKANENNVKTDYLKPEEITKLYQALEQDTNVIARAAIKFLLVTGVRYSEALTSRWQNVDMESGTLFLPDTKSGKGRHVILNDAALSILREMKAVSGGSPWVFKGKDPAKHYVNIRKPLLRVLEVAGLDRIRVHDLRHSFASLLVQGGASLYQVQNLLGHASPIVTQRYSHLASDTLRETSQMVSRAVNAATSAPA